MLINRLAGAALPADVPAFLRTPAALDALGVLRPRAGPLAFSRRARTERRAGPRALHRPGVRRPRRPAAPPPLRLHPRSRRRAGQASRPSSHAGEGRPAALRHHRGLRAPQSAFRDYRALVAAKQDTKPSEAEIVFLAGWLGHYVADGSQPLHTTIQYNGWTGPNPHGYTTDHRIHAQFETAFVHANVKPADVPASRRRRQARRSSRMSSPTTSPICATPTRWSSRPINWRSRAHSPDREPLQARPSSIGNSPPAPSSCAT